MDLHIEKEEIEKLKEEAQANKAHMLQVYLASRYVYYFGKENVLN